MFVLSHILFCRSTVKKKEEWVAVGYSCNLKYIGKVVSEEETTLMVRFLEQRYGTYETKKKMKKYPGP